MFSICDHSPLLEEMLRQQAAGHVRHIGFTGHKSPAALQRMPEHTDVPVTCQMPVNVLDPGYESFVDGGSGGPRGRVLQGLDDTPYAREQHT